MKHYAYTIFSNTLMSFVYRYIAKYGSDSVVREKAFTRITGTGKNFLDIELWDAHNPSNKVYSGATIVRPNVKSTEERHEDVVIDGRWQGGGEKRLEKVKPWDTLIPIGHGMVVNGTNEIVTNKCSNDGGTQTRTVNDLVKWFGAEQDNLSQDHVIIKLAMCYGGGGGDEAPADCFAKQLATSLYDAGWKTIMVGGYKGTFQSGGIGHQGTSTTQNNKKIYSQVVFTPNKSKVQHLGSNTSIPARENLIYFNGNGAILQASEVQNVKIILRGYPASADQDAQKSYVQNLRHQFTTQAPAHLALFPGKVLEMLEKRLGINVAPLQQVIQPPVQAQVQPPTQVTPKPQTQTAPKTQTQSTQQQQPHTTTQTQATGQKGKLCKNCGLWPLSTPGWKCPNGCTSALTRFG